MLKKDKKPAKARVDEANQETILEGHILFQNNFLLMCNNFKE